MDRKPKIDQNTVETGAMISRAWGFDLLLQVVESFTADFSLPPNDTPAKEESGPQQPQTKCHMPLGAAPLSLEQPVISAAGFLAAKNNPPLLHPNDTPAEEECGPQQPPTETHMPLGSAPLSLRQPIMRAPGFRAAQIGFPRLPTYYAPAEEKFNPQQSQTQFYMPLGAAPFSLQQPVMSAPRPAPPMFKQPTILQPNYMHCQAAPFHHNQVNNRPVLCLPQGHGRNLVPVGFINGEVLYGIPPPAAPPVASNITILKAHAPRVLHSGHSYYPSVLLFSHRRRYRHPHKESSPYVKKPPNAFMIYRKEQRPKVVMELQNTDCAPVNKLIGQRWRSMCKEEQAKYYELADKEKQLHSQRFPDWSGRDNYGIKRKRIRRRSMTDNSAM
nr:PREDICTED: transcription factor 7-like 1-A isoform X1 [Paralichthys olivaceus]